MSGLEQHFSADHPGTGGNVLSSKEEKGQWRTARTMLSGCGFDSRRYSKMKGLWLQGGKW